MKPSEVHAAYIALVVSLCSFGLALAALSAAISMRGGG